MFRTTQPAAYVEEARQFAHPFCERERTRKNYRDKKATIKTKQNTDWRRMLLEGDWRAI